MNNPDCFPHDRVRLLSGPLYDRQLVHGRYLQSIEPDRLLAVYRRDSGLAEKAESYAGWESRGIAGHSLGHYLSALSWHYQATGADWAAERVRGIVDELAECQKSCGDGGIVPVARPAFLDLREGKLEATNAKLNGYWVPFYTVHKLFAGLRDAYRLVGYNLSLKVEVELADWFDGVLKELSAEQIQTMLTTEHGGMNEAFADLAADTGDDRYLRMAADYFHHAKVLDPILKGEDRLDGLHGNTQIPKVVGLAREYELGGNAVYRDAARSFWSHVAQDRAYATGGHGDREHFFPPKDFPKHLTPYTCETCNSYNMLKLTSHLFAWAPDDEGATRMDFVERTLLNHVASNIGRSEGEFGYYMSLAGVAVKAFSTPYDSWWCCVGTGLENPTRYGEQIYFEQDDSVWVNLYAGSQLTSRDGSYVLKQETLFPEEDTVRFSIRCEAPEKLNLRLRHPAWCEQLELTLNGEKIACDSRPSSYFEIDHEWRDGDTLVVRLPMELHLEPLPHSDRKQLAVMFGPMLLAAIVPPEPGKYDPAKERYADHVFARGKTDAFPPLFVADDEAELLAGLEPTDQFGRFRSRGVVAPADLDFAPLYSIYEEHYSVYLTRLNRQEWTEKEAKLRDAQAREVALAAATFDQVQPGLQQPEIEHEFTDHETEACLMHHRHGRTVKAGGWCSYRLRCGTEKPVALVLAYWGLQWEFPSYDLMVDGEVIATECLRNNRPGDFFEVAYAVPPELTRGKKTITVRVQLHEKSVLMQFFDLRLMEADLVVGDSQFTKPDSVS